MQQPKTTRLAVAFVGLCSLVQSSGCTDLWKAQLVANPKNCAIAPAICGDLEECDYETERCIPLTPPACPQISFDAIHPQFGSRGGGTPITITGSNFQGSMRVEIDGTPLDNIQIDSPTQLRGTLGATINSCGKSPVTVISSCFERVSKESAFSYSLDPLTFDSQPQILPSSPTSSVQQIVIDDFNADGDPDIIGIEATSVRLFLSDGNGSFTTTTPVSLAGTLFQAAIGDANGDKAIDLMVSDASNPRLWLLLNSGKGVLSTQSIPMPEPLRGIASRDLNADGRDDVVAVGLSGTMYQLLGATTGFLSPDVVANGLPGQSQLVTLADLTTDGQPELIVAGGNSQFVEVWQKTGAKTFARLSQNKVPAAAYSVAAGDINGDGLPDVVAGLVGQRNVAVLTAQGGGLFQSAVTVPSGVIPRHVQLVDINCDGKLDLLASSATENMLGMLLGDANGTLSAGSTIDLSAQQPGTAQSLLARDVNFDGTVDLVVGSSQSPAYLLIANTSP